MTTMRTIQTKALITRTIKTTKMISHYLLMILMMINLLQRRIKLITKRLIDQTRKKIKTQTQTAIVLKIQISNNLVSLKRPMTTVAKRGNKIRMKRKL